MNPMAFMVRQALAEPPNESAQMLADIARRMGGVTYMGLVLATGWSRKSVERHLSGAAAANLVRVTKRGPRQIRWVEAI